MGKYVPDREFIFGNELRIREVLAEYNKNIHQFEQKDSMRAGVRARNNLLELFHLCRARRKEILERKKQIKEKYSTVHPSWETVDE
jgi:hypothetical protein